MWPEAKDSAGNAIGNPGSHWIFNSILVPNANASKVAATKTRN